MSTRDITIFHSPDADDAFMFYGMVHGGVSYPGYRFLHDTCDIESLNHRAMAGELDVTAVSVHAYNRLQEQYVILSCGASMGGIDYGPCIVSLKQADLSDGMRRRIAIPGPMTSATLALKLYLNAHRIEAELVPVHFDDIFSAIRSGAVDAGVIIHEGQITHSREGFVLLADLGRWWWETHSLPLPLGVNVARKSLGSDALIAAGTVIKQSIMYALAHRKGALDYALSFGRGISYEDADRFVSMYVNDYAVDLGIQGKKAIETFLDQGFRAGFLAQSPQVEFVDLSSVKPYA